MFLFVPDGPPSYAPLPSDGVPHQLDDIPGVTVELVRGSNTVVASTATDASGNYGFSRLGSNQADTNALHQVRRNVPGYAYTDRKCYECHQFDGRTP